MTKNWHGLIALAVFGLIGYFLWRAWGESKPLPAHAE